jgi:mRNA interferase MazF
VVSRGEVWLVLREGDQTAPEAVQPCLVLSPPEIHDHLGMAIVAPLRKTARPAGFHVPAALGSENSTIRLEQIRAVEKRRLTRQVGTVSRKTLYAALAALREMFAE